MKRTIPTTITEEEVVKIVKSLKRNNHKLAVLLGFYQCMRVSEVVNLKKENIRQAERLIEIKQAKGGKDRHIPIIKPLMLNKTAVLRALRYLPVKCGSRALQIAVKKAAKNLKSVQKLLKLKQIIQINCGLMRGKMSFRNMQKFYVSALRDLPLNISLR